MMKLKKTNGFTLLEVMIGLIIFSVGMLLLGSMTVVALRGNTWSNKTTEVVQAMRDKIEDFRHATTTDMVSGTDVVNGLSRRWFFEDLSTNLKKVTVVVSWDDQKAIAKRCSTMTYIETGS
jgi:prepilin-type N-terminal cleavage/methylation domain-containing protein